MLVKSNPFSVGYTKSSKLLLISKSKISSRSGEDSKINNKLMSLCICVLCHNISWYSIYSILDLLLLNLLNFFVNFHSLLFGTP